jgi:hypothetical protein
LRNAVLLRVTIGGFVQLIVRDSHEIAIGNSYYDVLIVIPEGQARIGLLALGIR